MIWPTSTGIAIYIYCKTRIYTQVVSVAIKHSSVWYPDVLISSVTWKLFFKLPETRGLLHSGPLDFDHPVHPIAMPLHMTLGPLCSVILRIYLKIHLLVPPNVAKHFLLAIISLSTFDLLIGTCKRLLSPLLFNKFDLIWLQLLLVGRLLEFIFSPMPYFPTGRRFFWNVVIGWKQVSYGR